MHRRPGVSHEGVDVALRLDDRSHVMMIAELEPLIGKSLGEFGHFRPVGRPVAFSHPRALGQRLRAVAVDGVRGLGDDDDIGARALGHRDMRFRRLEFLARRPPEQFRRVPAADEGHAAGAEFRLQRRSVAGHLVPLLHADDARLLRFLEARFERRVAADLLQVVVGPADRIGADEDGHLSLQPAAASARPRRRGARRRPPSAPTLPAPQRPTRSRRRRSSRPDRCR